MTRLITVEDTPLTVDRISTRTAGDAIWLHIGHAALSWPLAASPHTLAAGAELARHLAEVATAAADALQTAADAHADTDTSVLSAANLTAPLPIHDREQ